MYTLNDLPGICEEIATLRSEEARMSLCKKEVSANLEIAEGKALEVLVASNLKSFKSAHGTVGVTVRTSVKTPKTLEEKAALFAYLKEIGMYDELVSVNSTTLNSLYKSKLEEAQAQGQDDFVLPGVGEPSISQIISFRK